MWLYRLRQPWYYVGLPMLAILVIAAVAMTVKLSVFIDNGKYFLACVGAIILALEVWVALEGAQAIARERAARAGHGGSAE